MGLTAEAEKTRVSIAPLGRPACDYAIVTVFPHHRYPTTPTIGPVRSSYLYVPSYRTVDTFKRDR